MRQLALRMALISIFASKSLAHEYYNGQCPQFPPMKSFVWEKVGSWFCSYLMFQLQVCTWHVVCDQEDWDNILLSDLQLCQGWERIQAKNFSKSWSVEAIISGAMFLFHKSKKGNCCNRSVRQARQLLLGDTLGIDHEYMWAGLNFFAAQSYHRYSCACLIFLFAAQSYQSIAFIVVCKVTLENFQRQRNGAFPPKWSPSSL